MENKKVQQVVVLNHCNQWHEYSSFRLIGVVNYDEVEDVLTKIQKKLKYSDQDMVDYIDCQLVTVGDLDI